MPPAHRHDDARICGASTVVTHQKKVRVNGKLWAVRGDPNSHGGGALINSGTSVRIGGIPVIVDRPDASNADMLCPLPPHCAPSTAEGSPNVFAYGR